MKKSKGYPRKCATKFCRKKVKSASERSPYCSRCRSRRWKASNPLGYSFAKLRYRAKERGHPFQLTFDEYADFAVQSGYAEKKGKTAESFSIDRIDPDKGYEIDNIQCLTLADNSRKGVDVDEPF